jgi:lipopolysaccharide transport system ATP-binding protein
MSDVVIKAENLGKKYIIGHQAEIGRYVALRDVMMLNASGLWHKTKDLLQGKPIILGDTLEEFWALKDASFEIQRGEAVGIIGRNGAGKSTLLKILSRITEPSAGRVTIKGRVASLLEVGTGFHPELSGRENIYLNGAILGMKRAEIKRKFDEIVAFAEIEKFLDTPVKRYSSGMYVRLAFAVAAHLEPEILVVDEVLAVGDAAFQKKCLGKMGDVAKEGRTVLFVSHNMAAINRLCSRGIWLQNGQVHGVGVTTEIVGKYLTEGANAAAQMLIERRPNAVVQYRSVCVTDSKGNVSQFIPDDQGFIVEMEIEAYETMSDIYFGMILQNSEGINVLFADSRDVEHCLPSPLQSGKYRICLHVLAILAPGTYFVSLGIATSHPVEQIDSIEAACSFEIVKNSNMYRTAPRPGIVNLNLPWELLEYSK